MLPFFACESSTAPRTVFLCHSPTSHSLCFVNFAHSVITDPIRTDMGQKRINKASNNFSVPDANFRNSLLSAITIPAKAPAMKMYRVETTRIPIEMNPNMFPSFSRKSCLCHRLTEQNGPSSETPSFHHLAFLRQHQGFWQIAKIIRFPQPHSAIGQNGENNNRPKYQ